MDLKGGRESPGREVKEGNSKGGSIHKGLQARRAGNFWKPGVEVRVRQVGKTPCLTLDPALTLPTF